jgi:hypothetical protein
MLKTYLMQEWLKNNSPKYYNYFDEWYCNLTDNQKLYFEINMLKRFK